MGSESSGEGRGWTGDGDEEGNGAAEDEGEVDDMVEEVDEASENSSSRTLWTVIRRIKWPIVLPWLSINRKNPK